MENNGTEIFNCEHIEQVYLQAEEFGEKKLTIQENLALLYWYCFKDLGRARTQFLSLEKAYRQQNDLKSLAGTLVALAAIYHDLENYNEAQISLKQGLKIYIQINDPLGEQDVLLNLSQLAIEQNEESLAEYYVSKLDSLFYRPEIGGLKERRDMAQRAVDFFDFADNYERKAAYSDSLLTYTRKLVKQEGQIVLAQERAKLDVAQKEAEIQRQKFIKAVILGSSILVLLFLIGFFLWRNTKQKLLHLEKVRQIDAEFQRDIVEITYEATKNIKRGFHDNHKNMLSAASQLLNTWEQELDEMDDSQEVETHIDFSKRSKRFKEELSRVNTIILNLNDWSQNFETNIFRYNMDWLDKISLCLEAIRRAGNIKVIEDLVPLTRCKDSLSEEKRNMIGAIIINLLINVKKHAGAKTLWCVAKAEHHILKILVRDDGIGITTKQQEGIGLINLPIRQPISIL